MKKKEAKFFFLFHFSLKQGRNQKFQITDFPELLSRRAMAQTASQSRFA
jgi:hypothetical protein